MSKIQHTGRKHWIGVASLEHVLAAVHGCFCQVSHGKEAPVRRMKAGDVIIYYSPRQSMNGDILRAFSAVGRVLDDEPYQVEQALNFRPFRRKTRYFKSKHAPIEPLLKTLEFTRESNNWGFAFRRGMFPISKEDFIVIAEAMQIKTLSGACGGGTAQNGRFPKGDSKLLRLEKPACAEISVMDSPV